jgi:hypothetical protein
MSDDLTDFIVAQRAIGRSCIDIADGLGLPDRDVRLRLAQHARRDQMAAARFNPWRDLRERLAWNYGDASERMEKMQSDIAKWRGLGR